ncbi:hypothetical protein Gpo141_00009777 [Globisporangium polare]
MRSSTSKHGGRSGNKTPSGSRGSSSSSSNSSSKGSKNSTLGGSRVNASSPTSLNSFLVPNASPQSQNSSSKSLDAIGASRPR